MSSRKDINAQLVNRIMIDHERNSWFERPLDQEMTIKHLKEWVKSGMKEFGGIIDQSTTRIQFDRLIKKYEASSLHISRRWSCAR